MPFRSAPNAASTNSFAVAPRLSRMKNVPTGSIPDMVAA
jgi:hypothetical protein